MIIKKRMVFLVSLIIVILSLTSCQDINNSDNLPPEPPAVGKTITDQENLIGQAFTTPDKYAPPNDVFDGNKEIFSVDPSNIDLDLDQASFSIESSVNQEGGYIYYIGYIYKGNEWVSFSFDGELLGGKWVKNNANINLEINKEEANDGENYVVAYSCKKYSGEWKCGCKTVDGPCNMWMLQIFSVNKETEELPPDPLDIHDNANGCGASPLCSIKCGNSYVCINGNPDGCGGTCISNIGCGNNAACDTQCEEGYTCDATGDSCGGTCKLAVGCGNNVCESDESCEWDMDNNQWVLCSGNKVPEGASCNNCNYIPPSPTCGNGKTEGDEECDDNNSINNDACKNNCQNNVCGDGELYDSVEECDDGQENGNICNSSYGSSCQYCSSECENLTLNGPECGDGSIFNSEEQCDDGLNNDVKCTPNYGVDQTCEYCDSNCQKVMLNGPYCGDQELNDPEECDDGKNGNNQDQCDDLCHKTTCGDNNIQNPNGNNQNEQCDEGSNNGIECNPSSGSSCQYCSSNCQIVTKQGDSCGNSSQPCCTSGAQCLSNLVCSNSLCISCGAINQPCCANNNCTSSNSVCSNNKCEPCGGLNQLCCNKCITKECHYCASVNTACKQGTQNMCKTRSCTSIKSSNGGSSTCKKPCANTESWLGTMDCGNKNCCSTITTCQGFTGSRCVYGFWNCNPWTEIQIGSLNCGTDKYCCIPLTP